MQQRFYVNWREIWRAFFWMLFHFTGLLILPIRLIGLGLWFWATPSNNSKIPYPILFAEDVANASIFLMINLSLLIRASKSRFLDICILNLITILVFAIPTYFFNSQMGRDTYQDRFNLWYSNPLLAVLLIICAIVIAELIRLYKKAAA